MEKQYIQVSVKVTDAETKDIVLALLTDAGYEGFQEERWGWLAFIPAADFSEPVLQEVLAGFGLTANTETIAQQNWNAQWESSFSPVVVEDFCCVRAAFHEPPVGVQHDLIITPKMSFGTGHHATTYQVLQAMEKLPFAGAKVLDFGTGTGVLAILAEKLGAASVYAIDNDAWSIDNAAENIALNHCNNIQLEMADRLPSAGSYDVILANINRNVILASLPELKLLLRPGGFLIVSGLLAADANDLGRAIAEAALSLIQKQEKESWLCWTLKA